jgi:hypothetical protein
MEAICIINGMEYYFPEFDELNEIDEYEIDENDDRQWMEDFRDSL